jgi:DNA-binding XRE family transcriptional regulator
MSNQTADIIQIRWRPIVDFKDRLRLIRLEYGERVGRRVTQDELAELIDVKPATYGGWEAGTSKPADIVATARKIEAKLGADPTWLLDITDTGPHGSDPAPDLDILSSGCINRPAGGATVHQLPVREYAAAAA